MLHWRLEEWRRGLTPPVAKWGIGLWAFAAKRPWLYRLGAGAVIGLMGRLGAKRGRFRRLPFADGWTKHRDMPAPEGRTFMDQYASPRTRARWARR